MAIHSSTIAWKIPWTEDCEKKKYSFRAHRTTLKLVIDQERVKSRLYSWLRFIAV